VEGAGTGDRDPTADPTRARSYCMGTLLGSGNNFGDGIGMAEGRRSILSPRMTHGDETLENSRDLNPKGSL